MATTLPADAARLLIQSAHQAFDGAYLAALAVNTALLAAVAVMAWRVRAMPHLPGDAAKIAPLPASGP